MRNTERHMSKMDVPPSSTSHLKKDKIIFASLLLFSGFVHALDIINFIAVEESTEKKKEVTIEIEASIEDLENTPARFYFCDNENITLKNENFRSAPACWSRCHTQA